MKQKLSLFGYVVSALSIILVFTTSFFTDTMEEAFGVVDHALYFQISMAVNMVVMILLVIHFRLSQRPIAPGLSPELDSKRRILSLAYFNALLLLIFYASPLQLWLNARLAESDAARTIHECKVSWKEQQSTSFHTHDTYVVGFEICSYGQYLPRQKVRKETFAQVQVGAKVKVVTRKGAWMPVVETYAVN